jgi:hypothetical protein
MKLVRFACLFAVVSVLAIGTRPASGWGWNPFASTDKETAPTPKTPALDTSQGLWSKKSLKDRWKKTPPPANSAQPGVLRRASDLASLPPLRGKHTKIQGSNWGKKAPVTNTHSKSTKPDSSSWLGSMFKTKKPEPPKTVGEWINQDRPKF